MQTQSNKKLVIRLCGFVLAMFAFGFALVPLYDVFCDLTGINGRSVQRADIDTQTLVDTNRIIRIEFVTFDKTGQPSQFVAGAPSVEVHPGEMKDVSFNVTNPLNKAVSVRAIPSVSPGQGSLYLNKTECFCFNQQALAANETTEFKLRFFIDKALPEDIKVLTLAYTLYPISEQTLANAL